MIGEKMIKKILSIILMSLMCISIIPIESVHAGTTNMEYSNNRYWGQNKYDTSFAVADEFYRLKGKYDNVIVAYGGNFPDALSGGYLAKVRNAPILLVDQARESKVTQYIQKYMKSSGTVYILGGTGVVRKQYETTLKNKGFKVKRLAGQTAMDTNLEILKNCAKGADTLLIATKNHFADSLSASPVGLPIMLVNKNLTSNQKAWLKSSGIKKFCILGGTGAVPATIANELKVYGSVDRVWGQSRFDTSYAIAKKFLPNAKTITLVYGDNYPDGLSGAPLAMYYNSPIFLVNTKNWKGAHEYVFDRDIFKSITIGGTAVVTEQTIKNVMERGYQVNYDKPTWTWSGFTKATASKITYSITGKINNKKDVKETVNATISSKITKNATCTTTGIKTYTATAKFSNNTYTDTKTETIAKLNHKYGSWTKLNDTQHQRICANDKTHIEKQNHTWDGGTVTKVATESSTGIKTYTCSVCKGTKTEIIPKLNHTHDWGAWTVITEATCTTKGSEQRVCKKDNSHKENRDINALGHSYGSWTSLNDIQHQRVCSRDSSHIEKANHTWDSGKETKASTSTEPGEWTYTCTTCKGTKVEPIPVSHSHTFSTTWSSDDNKHWKASTCGHEIKQDEANHTWNGGVISTQATCTSMGKTTFTCTVCNKTKVETNIPKKGHSLTKTVAKAATCTANGNKEYWTCSTCKKVFSDSAGTKETTVSAMTINKLGHSYATTWTSDDTQHWHKCTRCSATDTKVNHTWKDGKCTVCNKVSACGHNSYDYLYQKHTFGDVYLYGFLTHCHDCIRRGWKIDGKDNIMIGIPHSDTFANWHISLYLNETKGYNKWTWDDFNRESSNHTTQGIDELWCYPTWTSPYRMEVSQGVRDYWNVTISEYSPILQEYGPKKIKNGFTAEVRVGSKCKVCGKEELYNDPWVLIKQDLPGWFNVMYGVNGHLYVKKSNATPIGGRYTLPNTPPGVTTAI